MQTGFSAPLGLYSNVPSFGGTSSNVLDRMRTALDDIERGRVDADLQGKRLRQASDEAAAQAIGLIAQMGASPERLMDMVKNLASRVFGDLSAQGANAVRFPQNIAAGSSFSLSVEFESLSVSADDKGNFSVEYRRVSLTIASQSYVAGLGADAGQIADFFGKNGNPPAALLLPERDDGKDLGKALYRLLAPVDPKPGLWALNI
jgi:hypothetical protein